MTHLGLSLRGANRGGFFLTASPDSSGKDSEDTIPTEGGDIPPLQGGKRMTGKTQGVALGYRIRPRWGRNSRACVVGARAWVVGLACVGGVATAWFATAPTGPEEIAQGKALG